MCRLFASDTLSFILDFVIIVAWNVIQIVRTRIQVQLTIWYFALIKKKVKLITEFFFVSTKTPDSLISPRNLFSASLASRMNYGGLNESWHCMEALHWIIGVKSGAKQAAFRLAEEQRHIFMAQFLGKQKRIDWTASKFFEYHLRELKRLPEINFDSLNLLLFIYFWCHEKMKTLAGKIKIPIKFNRIILFRYLNCKSTITLILSKNIFHLFRIIGTSVCV